jgi:hypothetical protein
VTTNAQFGIAAARKVWHFPGMIDAMIIARALWWRSY